MGGRQSWEAEFPDVAEGVDVIDRGRGVGGW